MDETWQPTKLDLVLSNLIALGFPIVAGVLYTITGALFPMMIYYGMAWGVVKLRRGSTGYFNPIKNKLPKSFLLNIFIILISLIFAYQAKVIDVHATTTGILFAIFVWAPVNASSEQLLWIYIFESYDLYPNHDTSKNRLFRVIGLVLFTIFVGLIHTMFWVKFLHTVNPQVIAGLIFVILTSVSGFVHILVWRESNNMIYTFIPHLILNIAPVLWTGHSVLPYL